MSDQKMTFFGLPGDPDNNTQSSSGSSAASNSQKPTSAAAPAIPATTSPTKTSSPEVGSASTTTRRPRGAGNAIRPGGTAPVRPTLPSPREIRPQFASSASLQRKPEPPPRSKRRTLLPWALLAIFSLGSYSQFTIDSEESMAQNFPAEVFSVEQATADLTPEFERAPHGRMWTDLVDSVKQEGEDGPVHVHTNIANTLSGKNYSELSEWDQKKGRAALGAADSICKATQITFGSIESVPPVVVYDRNEEVMASNLLWGADDGNCRRVPVPHD